MSQRGIMSEEITAQFLDKMEEILRKVSSLGAKLESLTEELARHQEELATLSERVSNIRLERAAERGYVAGALAVGGLVGGLAVKILL
jgi:chromosome segregation ATPase